MIAIPAIIHFLNRKKVIALDFSTLYFFKIIDKDSIQKIRIIQLLLLIIRTIIIFLIIMMILRPVIKGVFDRKNLTQSNLHVIIVDNTFSNQKDNEKIKSAAMDILNQIPQKGQLLWVNAIGGIQYAGLKDNFSKIKLPIESSYNASHISESLQLVELYAKDRYTSKEVYILTDRDKKNIQNLWEYIEKVNEINIYAIISNDMQRNLSISHASVGNEIIIPGHPFEIDVDIKNNGNTDIESALIQIVINNMSVGHQLISLSAYEEKKIQFKTILTSPGIHQVKIEIESDDRLEDNIYFLNLYIPKKREIALVGGSNQDFFYIKEALKALNKNNGLFAFSYYNSFHESNIYADQYDAVFMLGNSMSSLIGDSKVEEYLYNGGHLIILPTSDLVNTNKLTFKALDALLETNYDDISLVEIPNKSFQRLDLSSVGSNALQRLFSSNSGKDRNIHLFKYLTLPYRPAYTLLQTSEGSAIWNRHRMYNGIIDILGFDLTLEWTNFPLKGTFLPYMHFLIYSNVNREDINLTTDDNIYLSQIKYGRDMLFHIFPDGTREILINDDNAFTTDILKYPGFHSIIRGNEVLLRSAVNISESELLTNNLSFQDIDNSKPKNVYVMNIDEDIAGNIKKAKIGLEIWRYILYLLLILIIIEMLISNDIKKV